MKPTIIISLLMIFFIATANAVSSDNQFLINKEMPKEAPPKMGNFILPASQQPGSFISFGQNIINQYQTEFYVFIDDFAGTNNHNIDVEPSVLYGITNRLSVLLSVPVAASYKDRHEHSSGLEDASLQFEYAFYARSTYRFTEQATVVANMTFPTGSSIKQPPTGFGSASFFFGTTYTRTYTDWFMFVSPGGVFTTSSGGTRFGNQFLYQGGLGRNILDLGSRWIFAWLVEADGQYTWKDKINDVTDPNSGGNVIYLTPSLWISSKNLLIQLGVGYPVVQHWFGNQTRNSYLLAFGLGWSIY